MFSTTYLFTSISLTTRPMYVLITVLYITVPHNSDCTFKNGCNYRSFLEELIRIFRYKCDEAKS